MSDRGDFLRLLLVGPVIAPAAAKVLAEPQYLSGEVIEEIVWHPPSNAVVVNVYSIPAPVSSDVPNRLLGAVINDEGDAV